MKKEKIKLDEKTIANAVGANFVRPQPIRNTQTNLTSHLSLLTSNARGITLIALIITIIVMLILVAVTVSIAINGGLFEIAKDAANRTGEAIEQEKYWADRVISEVVTGWSEIEKPNSWTNDKVTAVSDGTNTIPLPQGYSISMVAGENTIEDGVVIKDNKDNEFVWIPVTTTFTSTYSGETEYSEPIVLTTTDDASGKLMDSQEELDYYYGANYYNYATDFTYDTHYLEMVNSVNKYGGFYVGRYETTIDGSEIGSKYNTEVLTRGSILKEGTNIGEGRSGEAFYYRWWGLYNANRKMNVVGNGSYLQTNMIWGQQWDAMIYYFNSLDIDVDELFGVSTQRTIVKSGQSTNSGGNKDCIYNIYDLRTNGRDWTAEGGSSWGHTFRGSYFDTNFSILKREANGPQSGWPSVTSRVTLYIG